MTRGEQAHQHVRRNLRVHRMLYVSVCDECPFLHISTCVLGEARQVIVETDSARAEFCPLQEGPVVTEIRL